MVSPKDLLQVNATILAGFFILVSIIGFDENPDDQIFRLNQDITILENQVKSLKSTIVGYETNAKHWNEKANDENDVLSQIDPEYFRKIHLDAAKSWEDAIVRLNGPIETLEGEIKILENERDELLDKYSLFKKPFDWLLLGSFFAISAIFAGIGLFNEDSFNNKSRFSLKNLSIGFMIFSFALLIVVIWYVNISESFT